MSILLAPLSSFALFDWGHHDHDHDHYYRRNYYNDRKYQELRDLDQKELDLKKRELDLIEREARIKAEMQRLSETQKPAPKK